MSRCTLVSKKETLVIGLGCRRFSTLTGLGFDVEVPAVEMWSDLIPVGVLTKS